MNLCIFQWCVVFLIIIEVRSNTKSSKVCSNDLATVNVEIETGDVLYAGTDAHIGLFLRSNHGVACQAFDLNNSGNDRERKSIDEYILCCPKEFLYGKYPISMLTMVQFTRSAQHASFVADDWFIERITVQGDRRILLDYCFHDWVTAKQQFLFGISRINDTHYIRF